MKPIIGITSSMELDQKKYMVNENNVRAIHQAGGIPLLLPYITGDNDIDQMVQQIDGLYLPGGYDIDPTLFGEEPHPKLGTIIPKRDKFEFSLIEKVLEKGKPILGVCRGSQILNIVVGGDMYQDIYGQIHTPLFQHSQRSPLQHGSHFVNVLEDSLLAKLVGVTELRVNSFHHQANRKIPSNFLASGVANDGIIEAIESKEHPFVLGVQWHPESMLQVNDEASEKIYKGFITACIEYKRRNDKKR